MKKQQFAVLGLGRFGTSIVKTLSEKGCEVLACDNNEDAIKEITPYATECVILDITNEAALKKLDLANFDCVIIAIGSSLETAVMATVFLKRMGVPKVIAKARTETERDVLKMVGADKVVLPERDMGMRLAHNLTSSSVLDYINFSDDMGIAEIKPIDKWLNQSLKELNMRAAYGLNVIAIKRNEKVIVSPYADEKILAVDVLVVIGKNTDLDKLV